MACNMWEAGPTSRMSVMREVATAMGLTPNQLNIAALVAQAVLYTGCRGYANFMEGPIPFDCMGNGKMAVAAVAIPAINATWVSVLAFIYVSSFSV